MYFYLYNTYYKGKVSVDLSLDKIEFLCLHSVYCDITYLKYLPFTFGDIT